MADLSHQLGASPLVILIAALIWAVLTVGLGIIYTRSRHLVRSVRSWRFAVEVAGIACALLVPMLLTRKTMDDSSITLLFLAIFLFFVGFCVLLPTWAALRYGSKLSNERPFSIATYLLGAGIFGCSTLLSFAAMLLILPSMMLYGFRDFWRHIDEPHGFLLTAPIAGLALTVEYCFVRAIFELIAFASHRSYRMDPPQPKTPKYAMGNRFKALQIFAFIVLVVWLFNYGVAFKEVRAYTPPPLSKPIMPTLEKYWPQGTNLIPRADDDHSFDPEPWLVLSILPPLGLLLITAIIVEKGARQLPSYLLCLLCIVHAVWQLDLFPQAIGLALWQIHVLAGLFVAPIALDFAVCFSTYPSELFGWRKLRWVVYGAFLVITPSWLYLWDHSTADVLDGFAGKSAFYVSLSPIFGISLFAGLISYPFCLLVSACVVIQACWMLRGISPVKDSTPGDACLWSSLSKRNGSLDPGRLRNQLRVTLVGTACAFALFVIWLIIVAGNPRVNPVSVEFSVKVFAFVFFLSAVIAVLGDRRWALRSKSAAESASTPIILAATVCVEVVQERVLGTTSHHIGELLAAFVLVLFLEKSPARSVATKIYRRIRFQSSEWHMKLKELLEGRTADIHLLLAQASPQDVTVNAG